LGNEKLLRFYWAGDDPGTHYYELYDLAADPSEAVNLAGHRADRVRALDALIEAHLRETDALTPLHNEAFTGSPRTSRASKAGGKRPASLHLEENTLKPDENRGSRIIQLRDESGKPCTTRGVVVTGGEWVEAENLADGSVEVRWDRSKGSGEAGILLGWGGGRTIWEINDWTLPPVVLSLR
jgi:hypothetical protein